MGGEVQSIEKVVFCTNFCMKDVYYRILFSIYAAKII